ncbi:hypothetical protein B0H16DRAFT_1483114 [Mycena metata]|uniref:Uncharacterized protein n=1 Tax=Mycena metata TaxID=1033252 RepID=A0AAD7DZ11_9AGAR|nr:hypothetical protein B0H16DRAFT_1483114 [Mycena metata]
MTKLQMEEVEEIEITEGAVGGIEINDGGADTNNIIEITDGGARVENVMEGEMEEGGGGEGEHLNVEQRAWAGRDYLALDNAIGSGSDSVYGLEAGPTVTPALGVHGISTLARWERRGGLWGKYGCIVVGLHEDDVRVTTQESGSGADEVVGAREATEDMRDVFIQIVLKVWLAAREGHRTHDQGVPEGSCFDSVFNGFSIILAEALTALQIVSKLTRSHFVLPTSGGGTMDGEGGGVGA